MSDIAAKRILIYRLGSIGDFVVSLPCLHLIRKKFPAARICLLTSRAPDSRAAAAETVLSGSGLIDEFIGYSLSTRNLGELRKIRRSVMQFAPDLLVYLAAPRGTIQIWRDYLFFRTCAIKQNIGFPLTRDLQRIRPPASEDGLWEREAHRLGRCLAPLGAIDFEQAENWDLGLTAAELAEADAALRPLASAAGRFIGLSIGTKQAIKDWGDSNWQLVLAGLSQPTLGLVLIGSKEDHARSEAAARRWGGPALNLCGRLSPRVSAAVIRQTDLFLSNDSGPMHLAAAVGTRCVAVYCKHKPKGMWFPYGTHRIFYPQGEAESIAAIEPEAVIAAAAASLTRTDRSRMPNGVTG